MSDNDDGDDGGGEQESKPVLWVTIDGPVDGEPQSVRDALADTALAEEYDIVVTDDGVETLGPGEAEEVAESLAAALGGEPE